MKKRICMVMLAVSTVFFTWGLTACGSSENTDEEGEYRASYLEQDTSDTSDTADAGDASDSTDTANAGDTSDGTDMANAGDTSDATNSTDTAESAVSVTGGAETAEASVEGEALESKGDSKEATISDEAYEDIQEGMTISEVAELLGAEGEILTTSDNDEGETVVYRWVDSDWGTAFVTFQNGIMKNKTQRTQ